MLAYITAAPLALVTACLKWTLRIRVVVKIWQAHFIEREY